MCSQIPLGFPFLMALCQMYSLLKPNEISLLGITRPHVQTKSEIPPSSLPLSTSRNLQTALDPPQHLSGWITGQEGEQNSFFHSSTCTWLTVVMFCGFGQQTGTWLS